jgi:hypothetical protein
MADKNDEGRAALEEVTQAAFNGVLRAVEARSLTIDQFPGPILIGIIAWPELSQTATAFGGGRATSDS